MSLRRYSEYRDSFANWFKTVPAHWDVVPLKYLTGMKSGGTPSKENPGYWDGEVPWASSKDLKSETLADTQDHIDKRAIDEGAAELIEAGAVLIVVRGMILAHTFPVVQTLVPMAINQDLKALTPREALTPDFLAWLLRGASSELLSRTDEAAHGTKVLRYEAWTSIDLPVPPLDEQVLIGHFLNRETSKIDALVTEQQRLMKLLKEKRQATISHAVTKGLNPHTPMKDCGLEAIGAIPAHWTVRRLSSVCEFQSGKAHEPFIDDEGKFVCVNSRFVSTDGESRKRCSVNLTPARLHDILMVMSDLPNGRALAKAFFVDKNAEYAVNQRVCVIRAKTGHPRFFYYLLNRSPILLQHDDGVSQTHLPNDVFTKFPLLIPPTAEQVEIAAYLDRCTVEFDTLAQESERAIDLLLERRTALISAAVTGQIDVRNVKERRSAA